MTKCPKITARRKGEQCKGFQFFRERYSSINHSTQKREYYHFQLSIHCLLKPVFYPINLLKNPGKWKWNVTNIILFKQSLNNDSKRVETEKHNKIKKIFKLQEKRIKLPIHWIYNQQTKAITLRKFKHWSSEEKHINETQDKQKLSLYPTRRDSLQHATKFEMQH